MGSCKWGYISPLIWVLSIVTRLRTLLITTHEPPSTEDSGRSPTCDPETQQPGAARSRRRGSLHFHPGGDPFHDTSYKLSLGHMLGQQAQPVSSRTQFLQQSDSVRYQNFSAPTAVLPSPAEARGSKRLQPSSRLPVCRQAACNDEPTRSEGFRLHLSHQLLQRNMLEGKEGLDNRDWQ